MTKTAVRRQALDLVTEALAAAGLRGEPAPKGRSADLVVELTSKRSASVRLLAAAAPHRRGGRGSLGLHWMLPDTEADYVALVDLSRDRGWLMPTDDFREQAQPVSGGRFHLDWIVVPLGKSRAKAPDEEEFAQYAFERALPALKRSRRAT